VAEWLKAPDSKSKTAFLAIFSRNLQPLIRSVFTEVFSLFAFILVSHDWRQKGHIV
jgi:hypothetical protein